MTYNLFIDDERDPFHVTWGNDQGHYTNGDWIIARNWYDVLEIIVSLGFPNMISFDHDLGEDTKSGYEIAKNICDLIMDANYELPEDFQFFVHSKNPVRKQNIEMYMNNFLNHMKG